jgi:hypothetical protein
MSAEPSFPKTLRLRKAEFGNIRNTSTELIIQPIIQIGKIRTAKVKRLATKPVHLFDPILNNFRLSMRRFINKSQDNFKWHAKHLKLVGIDS